MPVLLLPDQHLSDLHKMKQQIVAIRCKAAGIDSYVQAIFFEKDHSEVYI
jgi:hypothetical protein